MMTPHEIEQFNGHLRAMGADAVRDKLGTFTGEKYARARAWLAQQRQAEEARQEALDQRADYELSVTRLNKWAPWASIVISVLALAISIIALIH